MFVESVLRYGLPVNFQAMLLQVNLQASDVVTSILLDSQKQGWGEVWKKREEKGKKF